MLGWLYFSNHTQPLDFEGGGCLKIAGVVCEPVFHNLRIIRCNLRTDPAAAYATTRRASGKRAAVCTTTRFANGKRATERTNTLAAKRVARRFEKGPPISRIHHAQQSLVADGTPHPPARDVTFSSGKAMGLGLLAALPFVVVFGCFYRFALIDRAHLADATGLGFYLMLIAIVAISVFAHELLHAAGWMLAGKCGRNAIAFNISACMPSCSCKAPLSKRAYLIGVLFPFCVLGCLSVVFLFVYPGAVSVLTMIVNFVAAGADILVAAHVMREPSEALISDHPTKAGYVVVGS